MKNFLRYQWREEVDAFWFHRVFLIHSIIVLVAMILLPTILVLDVLKINPAEQYIINGILVLVFSWGFGVGTCYIAGQGTFMRLLLWPWGFVHFMYIFKDMPWPMIGMIGVAFTFASLITLDLFLELNHDRFFVLSRNYYRLW